MLLQEEKETHISISDKDTYWLVYTTQKTMMTKIEKTGIEPYKTEKDTEEGVIVAKHYKIPKKQIVFAKKRKQIEITEERREALKENMRKIRSQK